MPICQKDPTTGRMDYFGRMVNKTARITAAAHGGQIVCSGVAWKHAKDDSELGGILKHASLGKHKLKDISSEVEVFFFAYIIFIFLSHSVFHSWFKSCRSHWLPESFPRLELTILRTCLSLATAPS